MNSEASVKDRSASSFLDLPDKARLEVYRLLLVHHSYIQPQVLRDPDYYTGIRRAQRAMSNSQSRPVREFSPESAILATCSQIYEEAIFILYEENTFLYSCDMSIFNNEDYIKQGFPDQNLHLIKHLKLKAHPKPSVETILPVSVAATIEYFASRGCVLETFGLSLKEFESDDASYDEEEKRILLSDIGATSSQIMAAIVKLPNSQILIISLAYRQTQSPVEHDHEGTVGELYSPDFIKKLASQKNFKIIQEKVVDMESLGDKEEHEDNDSGDSDEFIDEENPAATSLRTYTDGVFARSVVRIRRIVPPQLSLRRCLEQMLRN